MRLRGLARQLDKPLGRGRIWRVTATDQPYEPFTRDLAMLDAPQLIELLSDTNGWVRDTSQRLLVVHAGRGVDRQLARIALTGAPVAAVHALWTLEGRGALSRRTVRAALARGEEDVRRAALRAGLSVLRRKDLLTLAASGPPAALAQEATLALARHNSHASVQPY